MTVNKILKNSLNSSFCSFNQKFFYSYKQKFATEYDSSDFEAPDIDIDNMLDEGLPEDMKERKKMHQYQETSKVVLEGSSNSLHAF